MNAESEQKSAVLVIDDDPAMRDSLKFLFRSVGLEAAVFASVSEFQQAALADVPSCLVLDVRLPGQSGLEFQTALAAANIQIPIIFMTGHGDIQMTVKAMKAGAIEFLQKPFRDEEMLHAVRLGLERDRNRREGERVVTQIRDKFANLTPREQEVMGFVAAGLLNKQIAGELGVAEITVKVHRGSVMHKMGAKSLAELVRMAGVLGIDPVKGLQRGVGTLRFDNAQGT
jgi:FixJ family two-component response regulator